MDYIIAKDTPHYHLVYNAYTDMAEPISAGDAIRRQAERTILPQVGRETSHGLGYDLTDGEVLVAFKLADLERLLAEHRGEIIKSRTSQAP